MGYRIIICSNLYPPNFIGGAELIAHHQAKELQNLGHDVIIFCGDTRFNHKQYNMIKDSYDGMVVYRVNLFPEDYKQEFCNFFHKEVDGLFEQLLDEFKPEIIHMHNIIGLSFGIIHLARRKGVKTIITLHDNWGFCYKNTILKNDQSICHDFDECDQCMPYITDAEDNHLPIRMRKDYFSFTMDEIDEFISPSAYIAENYIRAGINKDKMHVIWNGIDVTRFESIQKKTIGDTVRFTFIGYLGKHKGIHLLIQALGIIKKRTKVRVNIVGDGEMMEILKESARKTGVFSSVKFWGKIDNNFVEDVYQVTDVLVLPSIWPENQPVTITEAMAAHIPVIASNLGGNIELVENDKTGYVFECGNAVDLAKKMMFFIEDTAKISIFGNNAYLKMKNNSFNNQVKKIENVYSIPGKNITRDNKIILCYGTKFNPEFCRVIELFNDYQDELLFLSHDWIENSEYDKVVLIWVIDENITKEDIAYLFSSNKPIVTSNKNKKLKRLCKKNNSGLYYRNVEEAEGCLKYLLHNPQHSSLIGENNNKSLSGGF